MIGHWLSHACTWKGSGRRKISPVRQKLNIGLLKSMGPRYLGYFLSDLDSENNFIQGDQTLPNSHLEELLLTLPNFERPFAFQVLSYHVNKDLLQHVQKHYAM